MCLKMLIGMTQFSEYPRVVWYFFMNQSNVTPFPITMESAKFQVIKTLLYKKDGYYEKTNEFQHFK